jgi:hypothetical protein
MTYLFARVRGMGVLLVVLLAGVLGCSKEPQAPVQPEAFPPKVASNEDPKAVSTKVLKEESKVVSPKVVLKEEPKVVPPKGVLKEEPKVVLPKARDAKIEKLTKLFNEMRLLAKQAQESPETGFSTVFQDDELEVLAVALFPDQAIREANLARVSLEVMPSLAEEDPKAAAEEALFNVAGMALGSLRGCVRNQMKDVENRTINHYYAIQDCALQAGVLARSGVVFSELYERGEYAILIKKYKILMELVEKYEKLHSDHFGNS